MRRKYSRLGMAAAAALLMFSGTSTALAQSNPGDVDTSATVGGNGGGNAPEIECTWALQDDDHSWTGMTPSDYMDYGADDNYPMGPRSYSSGDNTPCVADGVAARQDDGWRGVVAVKPNAHDEPTQAYVELWAGISTSNVAGTTVRWDVWHPDGSPKVQIDGTRYSINDDRCYGPTGMFNAAVGNGQMTTVARDNMIAECRDQHKNFWYGAFPISKHQPYGQYKIVLTTTNTASATKTFYIDVLPFTQLEIDFTEVGFGTVERNSHSWQTPFGDLVWGPTGSTVRNTGNAGARLEVSFDPLCKQAPGIISCSDVKRIDKFNAHYGARKIQNMQHLGTGPDGVPDPNEALPANLGENGAVLNNQPDNTPIWHGFDNTLERTLCPNDRGKFEASIYTDQVIEYGEYKGELFLRGLANPVCRTDGGAVYDPPASDGAVQAAPETVSAEGYWN